MAHPAIETLTSAAAIGWYEEGIVAVDLRPDLLLVRPAAVVLATGGYDRALPFAGWDLPGVMTAEGARLLLRRHGVRPGSRAVVVTVDDIGHAAAPASSATPASRSSAWPTAGRRRRSGRDSSTAGARTASPSSPASPAPARTAARA